MNIRLLRQKIKDLFTINPNGAVMLCGLTIAEQLLVGKSVIAFGGVDGSWGKSKNPISYVIKAVSEEEGSWDYLEQEEIDYLSIRVTLDKYHASKNSPLIYTDPTFVKNINKLMKKTGYELDYTEQGMQGDNYVSMFLSNK